MFERFRRPRGADASEGSVATREREATTGPDTTVAPGRDLGDREDRTGTARFDREPAARTPPSTAITPATTSRATTWRGATTP